MDIIKICGLLKSFAFVMLSILGAFFQKWIDKANKRLFQPYRVSKKLNWPYFSGKIEIYGHDQNVWSPEKFYLCNVEHFGSLYSKIHRLKQIKHQFSPTGCPKNENMLILVEKLRYMDIIKMFGFLKSFAFVMFSILGAFFSKINRPT